MQKINNITTAVYNKLSADTTLSALITGVFGRDVDTGTAIPYVAYFVVIVANRNTFDETSDHYLLQIDCWAKDTSTKTGEQLVGEIASAVAGALDDTVLTISDYHSIGCQRISTRELYESEGKLYRVSMDYRVMVRAT
jgi:uncharacterized protein DUF3168